MVSEIVVMIRMATKFDEMTVTGQSNQLRQPTIVSGMRNRMETVNLKIRIVNRLVRVPPAGYGLLRRHLLRQALRVEFPFHAITFPFNDDGLGVMQQPIKQSRGEGAIVVKNLGPVLKGAIGSNQS